MGDREGVRLAAPARTTNIESTEAESGAMIYDWSISDDGGTVHACERYADSRAVVKHLATFGEKFAQRFLRAADPTWFVVHGTPDNDAKEALSAFGPLYMGLLTGFAR